MFSRERDWVQSTSAIDQIEGAAERRAVLFNGSLTIASGSKEFVAPQRVDADLRAGLKIVVLLSGRTTIKLAEEPAREISGPAALVIRSTRAIERRQVFAPAVPMRYVLLHLDEILCDKHLNQLLCGPCDPGHDVALRDAIVLASPAGRNLQTLATQLMLDAAQKGAVDLFLGGKALHLAATVVCECVADARAQATPRLSQQDLNAVRSARDLILASLRKPLGLTELARRIGINPHKLSYGFRQMFGATVHQFVQTQRLEEAHRLLLEGQLSVSQIAYHVGYSPAHFATAFLKHFGFSPSQARRS